MKVVSISYDVMVNDDTYELLKSSESEREEYLINFFTDVSLDDFVMVFED
jgi:hypothetical protein